MSLNLDTLPDETLLQICQNLDVPTLVKTAETYGRLNVICNEVIKEKKEDYLLDKKVEDMLNELKSDNLLLILGDKAELHGVPLDSYLSLQYDGTTFKIKLTTIVFAGPKYLEKIWPFPMKPKVFEDLIDPYRYIGRLETKDVEIIRQGLKKALQMGFKPSTLQSFHTRR